MSSSTGIINIEPNHRIDISMADATASMWPISYLTYFRYENQNYPQWHTSRSVYFQFAPYDVHSGWNIIKLIKWQLKRDVRQQIDTLMLSKCSFILLGNGFFYALH